MDDEDQDTAEIDDAAHDINDKMDEWIKIVLPKIRLKRKRKEKIGQNKNKKVASSHVA